jgi:hypothetical protein
VKTFLFVCRHSVRLTDPRFSGVARDAEWYRTRDPAEQRATSAASAS